MTIMIIVLLIAIAALAIATTVAIVSFGDMADSIKEHDALEERVRKLEDELSDIKNRQIRRKITKEPVLHERENKTAIPLQAAEGKAKE